MNIPCVKCEKNVHKLPPLPGDRKLSHQIHIHYRTPKTLAYIHEWVSGKGEHDLDISKVALELGESNQASTL